jgi:hypothetical protein
MMHSPASAFLRQFRRMGLVIEDDRVSLSDGVYSKCVQTIRSTHMSLAELVCEFFTSISRPRLWEEKNIN